MCLMHKCVCIWRYILQNYNYKLHFQNLSIYHIPHVFIGTLAIKNLDVCTACDLWDSNIHLTCWVCCWYWYQDLGGNPPPPLGAGHAFPRQWHMRKGGGLFIFAKVFFLVWCHPWMDDGTDGWVTWKSFMKNDHDVLYYMSVKYHILCIRFNFWFLNIWSNWCNKTWFDIYYFI
jgi:hypothetical protein